MTIKSLYAFRIVPMFVASLVFGIPISAQAQENKTQAEASDKPLSYMDLWRFDAAAHVFPEDMKDDLSACEGESVAEMHRAVRNCWPVYQNYLNTAAFRQARVASVDLVNGPDADLDELDTAKAKLVSEAFEVTKLMTPPRYPADLDLAQIAQMQRFNALRDTRQFQRALEDTNRVIGFYHQAKKYRETGMHNFFLHLDRVDMQLALENAAPDNMIDQTENRRAISAKDIKAIFLTAFFDNRQDPPLKLPLGIDPERQVTKKDCYGEDYAGLLRAIRFCPPIYQLYQDMQFTSLSDTPLKLSASDKIAADRILMRAERTDMPAADIFAIIALTAKSVNAYAQNDAEKGSDLAAQADKLIAKTPMNLAPDIRTLLAEMPEKVRAAKEKAADITGSSQEASANAESLTGPSE